jgi:YD repeat-containing protein
VQVETGGAAQFSAKLILPGLARPSRTINVTVQYQNTGNLDLPSPLLVLESRADASWQGVPSFLTGAYSPPDADDWRTGEGVSFLAVASAGPPATLRPGQTESISIPVRTPFAVGDMPFSLYAVGLPDGAGLDQPVNWSQLGASLQPPDMSAEAWNALFSVLTNQVGSTWGAYLSMLRENANYLAQVGQRVTDISDLFAFELLRANGLSPVRSLASAVDATAPAPGLPLIFGRVFPQSLAQRFELGPLGRGWSHNWQLSLSQSADGSVAILGPGGSLRMFTTDGVTYCPQAGDHATLSALAGGAFTLREPDGLLYAFRADGKLDYVEDTNGNRITAGYAGSLLCSLTHSSGQFLTIANNESGRIASVTDTVGRQTTFTYDASGEHLNSVQYYDGRTVTYSYHSFLTSAATHALIEIAYTGGTRRSFNYDTLGRLTETSLNSGAERVSFGYPAAGLVVATNAVGNVSQFFFDQRGLLVKTEDALGNAVNFAFDDNYNLVQVTDPAGRSHAYGYDANGNLTTSQDPLGHVSRFTFHGSLNRLGNVVDARGIVTRYDHSQDGNVLSITYADESRESWGYDDMGNATWWTNRRGSPVEYRYDSVGHLTNKVFKDGSQAIYQYDLRGSLTNAVTLDTNGLVAHFAALAYDLNDRLTNITYPDNKCLAFTYDEAGRRVSSLDQTGHLLLYSYDTLGRLQSMTNELGQEIVRYSYDPAGRVQFKRVGNGVYTIYDYDDAGQLLRLTNHLADGSAISWFNYAYDSRGRRTSMGTHYGNWTYEYDDLGQLTRAVLVSTDADIANQDLNYVYDATGNRVRTIENGVTTEYTANNLNQYLWVGTTNFEFDLDGNLIQEITADRTNTFNYSHENRLASVRKGLSTTEYSYDAFGNRLLTTESGITIRHVFDPVGLGNVVGEYDGFGRLLCHYDHALGLVSRIESSGSAAFYTFDAVGNVQHLVTALGDSIASYHYEPFGRLLKSSEVLRTFLTSYFPPNCRRSVFAG